MSICYPLKCHSNLLNVVWWDRVRICFCYLHLVFYCVWSLVIFFLFLWRVSQNVEWNDMSTRKLAAVFAPLLLRPSHQNVMWVKPLSPDMKIHILLTVLHNYIPYGTGKGKLSKYQHISSLVITSFILITWVFEQVVIV